MTRRLTLHIGSHKTGTTSLQSFLARNNQILRQRGVDYVHAAGDSVNELIGSIVRAEFLPQGCYLRNRDEFLELLAQATQDHVIASSESFSYFFQPESIADLAGMLRPLFSDVRILVYLRRQDRHAVSHHQEAAKPHRFPAAKLLWGNDLSALPAAHPRHALYLDYDRRIGHWADAFGEEAIIARVFDRASLKDGDLVADALQALGIASQGLQPIADLNTSLGAVQSWVGHKMNAADVPEAFAGAVLQSLPKGPRALPARAAAQAFYHPYREGNARLNARLKISPLPGLFDEDFDDYPETETPVWDLAAAEAGLDAILPRIAATGLSADDLRDAALGLRTSRPGLALRLARAAQAQRPTGPAIRRLVETLEREVGLQAGAKAVKPAP